MNVLTTVARKVVTRLRSRKKTTITTATTIPRPRTTAPKPRATTPGALAAITQATLPVFLHQLIMHPAILLAVPPLRTPRAMLARKPVVAHAIVCLGIHPATPLSIPVLLEHRFSGVPWTPEVLHAIACSKTLSSLRSPNLAISLAPMPAVVLFGLVQPQRRLSSLLDPTTADLLG